MGSLNDDLGDSLALVTQLFTGGICELSLLCQVFTFLSAKRIPKAFTLQRNNSTFHNLLI